MTACIAPWHIDQQTARLEFGALQAAVTLGRPDLGLHGVRFLDASFGEARLLAPRFEGDSPRDRIVADSFTRQHDLVVTYAPTDSHPVRMQVYWRVVAADFALTAVAIDVQVSVQTNLLDARPAMAIESSLPTSKLWQIRAGGETVPYAGGGKSKPSEAIAWLCRSPGEGFSYGEMLHHDDVEGESVRQVSASSTVLSHRVFAQPLEKGVILRARSRGVFVKTADGQDGSDVRAIVAAYEDLRSAPLPLTT